MEYDNPKIPEGINTSKEHPLKEFTILVISVLFILFVVITIVGYLASNLAHYIPFEFEQTITANLTTDFNKENVKQDTEIQHYLQNLTNRIVKASKLPSDMSITVHYVDSDTVNAFATLGGHLIFFRGLLEQLPNENALAMVVSHEVAHIKHRHPIEGLSRAALLGVIISMVTGSTDNNILRRVLGDAGLISAMTFSRDQERIADETALHSLHKIYGHINGAKALFGVFTKMDSKQKINMPQFLRSHPLTDNRIKSIELTANKNHWKLQGVPTKLPEDYYRWLEKQK